MISRQSQKGGEGSQNNQSGRDTNVTNISIGVSVAEARDIALDVFNANFFKLSGRARDSANERVETITREYIDTLQQKVPQALGSAADPDMQVNLFNVQRDFARSGEGDLASLLVDLLVDRATEADRNVKTLVLNEAIGVAPRLTREERATLAIIYLIRHRDDGLLFGDERSKYDFEPFVDRMATRQTVYMHMASVGVGWLDHQWNLELGGYRDLRRISGAPKAVLERLVKVWNSSPARHFELTMTGIAIGHFYWKAITDNTHPRMLGDSLNG
jgi:hypothetical protein